MTNIITEEDGTHKEWMPRAKAMTLETLPEFLRELTEDYEHDYGTICHAIAAAAVAAAWAVEHTPQGGITGFQAGAITWEIIKGWDSSTLGKIGTRIQKMDDLLYPQMAYKFNTISQSVWESIREKAGEELEAVPEAHVNVRTHWQSIVDGVIPFGLTIAED